MATRKKKKDEVRGSNILATNTPYNVPSSEDQEGTSIDTLDLPYDFKEDLKAMGCQNVETLYADAKDRSGNKVVLAELFNKYELSMRELMDPYMLPQFMRECSLAGV